MSTTTTAKLRRLLLCGLISITEWNRRRESLSSLVSLTIKMRGNKPQCSCASRFHSLSSCSAYVRCLSLSRTKIDNNGIQQTAVLFNQRWKEKSCWSRWDPSRTFTCQVEREGERARERERRKWKKSKGRRDDRTAAKPIVERSLRRNHLLRTLFFVSLLVEVLIERREIPMFLLVVLFIFLKYTVKVKLAMSPTIVLYQTSVSIQTRARQRENVGGKRANNRENQRGRERNDDCTELQKTALRSGEQRNVIKLVIFIGEEKVREKCSSRCYCLLDFSLSALEG